ncbi:MAG TPA: P-loop NTPase fold protein [Pseudonocardiaceae bacterium]
MINGVEFSIARTSKPWVLKIDTLVLSAAYSLGSLGMALQEQFPDAAWPTDYSDLTPDRPALVELDGLLLRRAIVATPCESDGDPSLSAITMAAERAIAMAIDLGAIFVGMPLLATGLLGSPVEQVAPIVIQAVLRTLRRRTGRIRRVAFVCRDIKTDDAIRAAWNTLPYHDLITTPVELAGGVSSDLVDPNVGIPLANDRLGVAPYVSMLATVMADRSTPLPLSVGIFGRWGSGKSYFMGMLRDQIERLAGSAGNRYCGEIVQIGFNAWHYADSNLWASLGDEIFRQLDGPDPSSRERAARIRDELAERLDQRKQLDADTRQAQATVAALRAKVDTATAEQETSARDLIAALRKSPVVKAKIDKLWGQLGVTDDVEQARLLAEQLRDVRTEADALSRIPRDRTGRIVLGVAAVLFVVGVAAALLVPVARTWLAGVIGLFGVVASAGGITVSGRARAGLRSLRDIAEDVRAGLDGDAEQAVAELRNAEADQQVAEAQLAEVVARVGEIGRQLTELTPGRRLYTFLADRARGDSYTRNLGLVSTIRKDFQQLVTLMNEWRTHPDDGTTSRRPVNRIVLYIDDLDRCTPRAVVDVLQAVHLLLAFDLFIVVVGVDPRWLLKSLSCHYDKILDLDGSDTWQVSPEDYLEKILNIPLVLPGMSSGSLSGLLRSMVEVDAPSSGEPAPAVRSITETLSFEPGSDVDAQLHQEITPQQARPLTEPEIALLSALDPLVDTPREAKRLVNLYRMLRATRDLSEASRFLGDLGSPGEYQAVVVLLGLLTAHARLLGAVLDARPGGLVHRAPETPLADFVADVEPRQGANGIVGRIADGEEQDWVRLHRGLTQVCGSVTLPDVSCFQAWAPRIRRFSYVLSAPADRAAPVPGRASGVGAVPGHVHGEAEQAGLQQG